MVDLDKLFEIFRNNPEQEKKLEEHYLLRMTKRDDDYYGDQKDALIAKCLRVTALQSLSDQSFICRLKGRDDVATKSYNTSKDRRILGIFALKFPFWGIFNISSWQLWWELVSNLAYGTTCHYTKKLVISSDHSYHYQVSKILLMKYCHMVFHQKNYSHIDSVNHLYFVKRNLVLFKILFTLLPLA